MCIQESSEGKWRTEEAVMLKMVYTFYTHTHTHTNNKLWECDKTKGCGLGVVGQWLGNVWGN